MRTILIAALLLAAAPAQAAQDCSATTIKALSLVLAGIFTCDRSWGKHPGAMFLEQRYRGCGTQPREKELIQYGVDLWHRRAQAIGSVAACKRLYQDLEGIVAAEEADARR